jgi:L-methionine (R)-S-oxide reductase
VGIGRPSSVVQVEWVGARGSVETAMIKTNLALEARLRAFLSQEGGIAGTVHERDGEALVLRAAVNIPEPVIAATQTIPKGKGMAGLAWERDRAVAVCNIRTDASGDVRPGAKAVDAQAALAIPVRDGGCELRAVVGIAFGGEREFGDSELSRFERVAADVLEG